MDAKQVWRAALGELQVSLSPANYETWLRDTQLVDVDEQRFRIAVPNGFAKDWLETRYRSLISQTLARIVGYSVQVEFTVSAASDAADVAATDASNGHAAIVAPSDQHVRVEATRVGGEGGATNLNPRYTFANFIVGSANRLGHAASLSVAERPGHAYNPLFLYGGVGLGKTHLMHAIGHMVREQHRQARVAYITSEKFMNEMITSIQENRTGDFRDRYRSVDVLLIDDIQFFAGKDRTQEEFFHTFNALHEIQKQIVVSSDRPPKDIPTLEDRLRSRFEGGLMADIQPPDFETRLAILNRKLGPYSRLVPDEVCAFIAHRIQRNIRELEGALIRVLAHASINGQPITLDVAQQILRDIIPVHDTAPLSIEAIQDAVADHYTISVDEMKGKRRDKHIVFPRQVAMYLIREETDSSLPVIGGAFGGRDHTTALHAIEKITELVREDTRLQSDLRQIRQRLHSR